MNKHEREEREKITGAVGRQIKGEMNENETGGDEAEARRVCARREVKRSPGKASVTVSAL